MTSSGTPGSPGHAVRVHRWMRNRVMRMMADIGVHDIRTVDQSVYFFVNPRRNTGAVSGFARLPEAASPAIFTRTENRRLFDGLGTLSGSRVS